MKDFDNTSPSALLHAYLEGDLDSFEEPRLFSMLAESAELRGELHDCLLIGNLVDADSDRLMPGGELRDKVWERLGLGMKEAPVRGTPVAPFWSPRIVGVALLSAVIAVLLTIGALSLLDRDTLVRSAEGVRGERVAGGSSSASAAMGEENAPAPSQPSKTADRLANQNELSADGGRVRTQAITSRGAGAGAVRPAPSISDRPAYGAEEDRTDEARTTKQSDVTAAPLLGVAPVEREPIAYHPSGAAPIEGDALSASPLDGVDDVERRFLLQAHGVTASSFPRVAIGQPSDPLFNNLSAGVGYALSEQTQVAIEVGQEPFTQRYRGMENGRGVTYTQRPLLFWAGASLRYELDAVELPGGIHPYAKIMMGGTEVGPLFKGALGLSYLPDARVGFSLGIEGSLLPYSFQNRWFTSQKVGVVYGLSLLL